MLAGREELLTQLGARLSGGDDPVPRTVVLCGLGGAGKTSVAVEYAHRHLAEVGVAWQFAAADATVLAAGFAELAAQLGARGLADARDPVASVHAVLARFPAPWLLVFDNAPSRASVQAFLPPTGRGRVLITSRDQTWPPGQALEVPVLDQQVAAGFLANRTGDTNGQAAWDLAGELGGLPLALEQAAAYIQASGGSLAGYLSSFRQRRADMLGRGEPIGYPATVATTWRLAFGELERSAPSAVGLLQLLACCAPEAVPLPLLFQRRPGLAEERGVEVSATLVPLLEDPLVISDAVAALRRYSLVTLAGGGSVSVHRLVQAVTVDQMPADMADEWRQVAADLIEAAIPDDAERPETWPVFEALLPHAQVALADDSDGIDQLAGYLGYRGSYASALELERRFRDALEPLGPGHPRGLAACVHFAYWTGRAGDAATARDQDAALLPVCERVFGPEHSETLAARTNLARWTGEAGDAAGARDQSVALLSVCERVFGPEHPRDAVRPDRPGPLDRGGGGCGRGTGPVRGAAARVWAGSWPRAPVGLGHPHRAGPLDRAGGGCGRGP